MEGRSGDPRHVPGPSPDTPRPGDVLAGRWVVERVIGRGGMGVVVAARDQRSQERVAIKLMYAHELKNAVAVERFFREARAALRIVSPHVARVLEVARLENGRPYIVMELLEGEDLFHALQRSGPLPVGDAARFAREAASGCAIAHAAGVVHRDLKPANLFVARTPGGAGTVKLLDFGISKLSGLSGTVGHQLTADGDLTGSPLYMSPEQLRAKNVDARADVWALGATLYELLTGQRPFQAENMMAECNRILLETPTPPSALRAGVPPGLDAVVLRCLEKDPAKRYPSASDLADALAPFASAGPTTKKKGGLGVALLVGLLLGGVVSGVGWLVWRAQGRGGAPAAVPSAEGSAR